MFKLIVLCAVLTFVAANPLYGGGRVVNGTDAKLGEIPYIISLRINGRHSCGGSILDELHVLTAAHCVDGSTKPASLAVQYGIINIKNNDNVVQVAAIHAHELFNRFNSTGNDVAVLKLASPIKFGEQAQKIVLPEQDEAPPGGEWGVLAGWGYDKSWGKPQDDLKRVDILVYTDEDCKKAHGSSVDASYHVCSGVPEGGKGQCSGDSGGPLYGGGKQVGVVSWSIKPCGVKGYPGVYARVSSYVDWIKSKAAL